MHLIYEASVRFYGERAILYLVVIRQLQRKISTNLYVYIYSLFADGGFGQQKALNGEKKNAADKSAAMRKTLKGAH